MAEQLYQIPVNDAFSEKCECPLCLMANDLERNAIEYTLGPSYMEDDNRAMTDELGFCTRHIRILYGEKNRLGLALMLKTHTDKTIKDMKALASKPIAFEGGLLKKKGSSPVIDYVKKLDKTCFVCDRTVDTFERYIDTIIHLYKKDSEFVKKFESCQGFCTHHYGILFEKALEKLPKANAQNFIDTLNKIYFENMERVNEDISWFIDKFDYRNKDADWKNSKDALPRTIIKTNHEIVE